MKELVSWLVYMHTPNGRDLRHGNVAIRKMRENFQRNRQGNVSAYVIHFGPTVKSKTRLLWVTGDGVRILLELDNPHGIRDAERNVHVCVSTIQKHARDRRCTVRAVCFWCHGAGFGCSPWKKWKEPLLTIRDAVKWIIAPFKVSPVCFDACYQGSMSCLYELPEYVKATVAAPAFHPFVSILWTRAFGELQAMRPQKRSVLDYAHRLNCEWNTMARVKWKCLLVFDMTFIRDIAKLVAKRFPDLVPIFSWNAKSFVCGRV